jgi:uncharacterized protein (TIGR03067 family)
MTIRSLIVVGLMLWASANHTAQERTPLEGAWLVVSVAINGQVRPSADVDTILTFEGNTYTQAVDGIVNERGTIKVDSTQKPMAIDFVIDDPKMIQLGVLRLRAKRCDCISIAARLRGLSI